MRISDWSSDGCSSDLIHDRRHAELAHPVIDVAAEPHAIVTGTHRTRIRDRKSVVSGKSVSVRVDLGGRRILNKTKHPIYTQPNIPHNSILTTQHNITSAHQRYISRHNYKN